MLSDDPEAPTTTKRKLRLRPAHRRRGHGLGDHRRRIDRRPRSAPGRRCRHGPDPTASDPAPAPSIDGTTPDPVLVDASAAPPHKQASNFLVVAPRRSATGNTAGGDGPAARVLLPGDRPADPPQRAGHRGPGRRGARAWRCTSSSAAPPSYAWSLTSADHDVRDVFAEQLCEPDGSAPTRASTHYVYDGRVHAVRDLRRRARCRARPIRYPTSVHGPMIGTATVGGMPYALTRQRSTFGRDGLNLAALNDMTDGAASTRREVLRHGQRVRVHVQLGLRLAPGDGLLLVRATCPCATPASTAACPTLGTGGYEWQGFLTRDQHPHDSAGPGGLLLNWNNKSAPGFMHGDDEAYGSVHRVELFDKFPKRRHAGRRRQRDEPGRHRGRPLARVADGQRGAGHRPGSERARRAGRGDARRLGRRRRAPPRRRRQRAVRRSPGRPSWTRSGARSPRPSCGRCTATCIPSLDRVRRARRSGRRVLRRQGPAHPAQAARQGSVRPEVLRQRFARRLSGVAVGRHRHGRGHARRARRAPTRRPGAAPRPAPASCPASSPTRSGPRTARPSSRCSSS